MRISDWSSDVCSSDLLDDAGLDERVGRLHVHHLGRSGIADRPAAAHEEEAVLVDRQRRIVDAAVIVFRPLEDDGTALEDVLVAGTAEIALAKGGADHRRLHEPGVEEVSRDDRNSVGTGRRVYAR